MRQTRSSRLKFFWFSMSRSRLPCFSYSKSLTNRFIFDILSKLLLVITQNYMQLKVYEFHLIKNYYKHMPVGAIASIKVPNNFAFNLSQVEKFTKVDKESTFCEVVLFKQEQIPYAMKIIHKDKIAPEKFEEEYRRLTNEITILYQLKHPNIIKLWYHEQKQNEINILMEYGGKRLFKYYIDNKLGEGEIADISRQILLGLKYVHEEGFIHRDLTPENILINSKSKQIKIIDFGFVAQLYQRKTEIGTFLFMAPEVTGDNLYNQKVDIWSLGMIVYEMLHQEIPFFSRRDFNEFAFRENRQLLRIQFDKDISAEAIDFVRKALVLNPENRASAEELLRHPFVALEKDESDLSFFDRQNTEKKNRKTQKNQKNRQKQELKSQRSQGSEDISEMQLQLKRNISEMFACFRHHKDTMSELIKTYKNILNKEMLQLQK